MSKFPERPTPYGGGADDYENWGCPDCGSLFTLPSGGKIRPYCTHYGNYAWPSKQVQQIIENQRREGRETYTRMVRVRVVAA